MTALVEGDRSKQHRLAPSRFAASRRVRLLAATRAWLGRQCSLARTAPARTTEQQRGVARLAHKVATQRADKVRVTRSQRLQLPTT